MIKHISDSERKTLLQKAVLTAEEAAKVIGRDGGYVRAQIRYGRWDDIAACYKPVKGKTTTWTYEVYTAKMAKKFGIEVN